MTKQNLIRNIEQSVEHLKDWAMKGWADDAIACLKHRPWTSIPARERKKLGLEWPDPPDRRRSERRYGLEYPPAPPPPKPPAPPLMELKEGEIPPLKEYLESRPKESSVERMAADLEWNRARLDEMARQKKENS